MLFQNQQHPPRRPHVMMGLDRMPNPGFRLEGVIPAAQCRRLSQIAILAITVFLIMEMIKAIKRIVSKLVFGQASNPPVALVAPDAADRGGQTRTGRPAPAEMGVSGQLQAYSIRESLYGALHDFVRDSGFDNADMEEIIRELVGMLAAYREEDSPLFPEVFVFSSPTGLTALAPSSTQVTIGTAPLAAESATDIVKNCAPLAASGWAIFVVQQEQSVRYGVFRAIRHSLALGAEESMHDLGRDEPVVLIRNRGHLTVELRSTTGSRFTATLTTTAAKSSGLEAHVGKFVAAATGSLPEDDDFRAYLKRLITDALQHCHGTLLAIVDNQPGAPHATLQDGIWLDSPIRLADLRAAALQNSTADALADLMAAEILLRGMINSDGVVVFRSDGSVVAFRVFLTASDEEAIKLPASGGGRRRTFELMKLRLGQILMAVFFRSQDGETRCERANQ